MAVTAEGGIARSLSASPLEPKALGASVDSAASSPCDDEQVLSFPHVGYLFFLMGIPVAGGWKEFPLDVKN